MARWIFTYILAICHKSLILLLGTELLGESAGISSQCRVEAESSVKGLFWYLNYYHGVHSRTWTFHSVQLSSGI
ncbi:hypothetical protein BKA60DRAFT_574787 [Fusarium oxysporum]|nr:hypothetical protein BKA60DRAFT_574787 [Fusarium oxysporum]